MEKTKKEAQQTSTHPYYTDSKGNRFSAKDVVTKKFKPSGRFKKSGPVPEGSDHMGASVSEVLKNPPLNK